MRKSLSKYGTIKLLYKHTLPSPAVQRMALGFILLFTLFSPSTCYKRQTCLSDEYSSNKFFVFGQNYTTNTTGALRICLDPTNLYLADSKTCKAIGQTVDIWSSTYTCEASDLLTTSKADLILSQAQAAVEWIGSLLLAVPQVEGDLNFEFNSTSRCGYDGGVEMVQPRNLTDRSVCDLVVLLTAWPMALKEGSDEAASAVTCASDQNERPVAGQVNLNPNYISDATQLGYLQVATVAHQLIHILGFSAATLQVIDSRFKAAEGRSFLESSSVAPLVYKNATYVVSNFTAETARDFFSCSALPGAELENTPFAEPPRLLGHWAQRIFDDELMAASIVMRPKLTLLTLSLLKDTGWYSLSFNATVKSPLQAGFNTSGFGAGEGCEFALGYCSDWNDTKGYLVHDVEESDFCLFDRRSKGVAALANYTIVINETTTSSSSFDWSSSSSSFDESSFSASSASSSSSSEGPGCLPAELRAFPSYDCHVGGADEYAEACPIVESGVTSDCGVAQNDDGKSYLYGEVFGEASGRCLFSSLVIKDYAPISSHPPRCYPTRCTWESDVQVTLEIQIGPSWHTCPNGGGSITASTYYTGEVICPDAKIICPVCVPPCINGKCEEGVCACEDGWTGYACEIFEEPKRVTSIQPRSGPAAGGTTIIIGGSGFSAGNVSLPGGGIRVSFGNVSVNGTYLDKTTLLCKSPAYLGGETLPSAVEMSISIDGSDFSYENNGITTILFFTIYSPPNVSQIVPSALPLSAEGIVALVGTGLVDTEGEALVLWGGGEILPCHVLSSSLALFAAPPRNSTLFSVGDQIPVAIALNGQDYVALNDSVELWDDCRSATPIRCVDGSCASAVEDCPCLSSHPYTCGSDCVEDVATCQILERSDFLTCPVQFFHRCSQRGTCRVDVPSNCPSAVVCPPGFVLCPGGNCIPFTSSGVECPATELCDDNAIRPITCDVPGRGSKCARTRIDCPTALTCPSDSESCMDLYCVEDEASCVAPLAAFELFEGAAQGYGYWCNSSVVCFDGTPVNDTSACPTRSTCPFGFVRCESGDCVSSLPLCPSAFALGIGNTYADEVLRYATRGSDADISRGLSDRPSRSTCPNTHVMCSDGSCAATAKNCRVYSSNELQEGIWRASFFVCPADLPIHCVDGLCAATAENCSEATLRVCPEASPRRCPDGSCVAKLSSCPTPMTCPPSYPVRCELDGGCRQSSSQCVVDSSALSAPEGEVVCPDGSIADSYGLCGELISCNPNRSVLCWSGSCAESEASCPPIDSGGLCGVGSSSGMVACGSGAGRRCSDKAADCPSVTRCPVSTPVKCEDGTCVTSNTECPGALSCPNGTFYCAEGVCVTHPGLCGTEVTCTREEPVRCSDGTCRRTTEDCMVSPATCDGFLCHNFVCESSVQECSLFPSKCSETTAVLCPDYSCANSSDACLPLEGAAKCPPWMSKRCPDGRCVSSDELCDGAGVCPSESPVECALTGECTTHTDLCINEDGCRLSEGTVKCFGSCESSNSSCVASACPSLSNISQSRCLDGSCRISSSSCDSVSPSGCPTDKPFPCLWGASCAASASECSAVCPPEAPFRCMNGLCAISAVTCPPFPMSYQSEICWTNKKPILCADGSCVATHAECPHVAPCDSTRPVRCLDGTCRPANTPFGEECCPTEDVIEHRCPMLNSTTRFHLCDSGECAPNSSLCTVNTTGCPAALPFRGEDGTCYDSTPSSVKATKWLGCLSETAQVKCWNGECVRFLNECRTSLGCPQSVPIRCMYSGECVATLDACSTLDSCSGTTCPTTWECATSYGECPTNRLCPRNKPYRDANGTCVSANESTSVSALDRVRCSEENPYRCSDGRCVASRSVCTVSTGPLLGSNSEHCPITARYECYATRDCVSDVFECLLWQDLGCPDVRFPFRCIDGECVKKHADCFDSFNFPADQLMVGEICSDGSARDSNLGGICPPIHACPGDRQALCLDGSCEQLLTECPFITNPCGEGEVLCADGICRSTGLCPDFIGCPWNRPIACENGYCAVEYAECEQYGGSGKCVSCVRNRNVYPIEATVALWEAQSIPLITAEKGRVALVHVPDYVINATSVYNDGLHYRVRASSIPNSRFRLNSLAAWKGFHFEVDTLTPVISLSILTLGGEEAPAERFEKPLSLYFGLVVPVRFDVKKNVCLAEYIENEDQFRCVEDAALSEVPYTSSSAASWFAPEINAETLLVGEVHSSGMYAVLGISVEEDLTIFEQLLDLLRQLVSIPIVITLIAVVVLLVVAMLYSFRRAYLIGAKRSKKRKAAGDFLEVSQSESMEASPKEIDDDNKDTESSATTGTDRVDAKGLLTPRRMRHNEGLELDSSQMANQRRIRRRASMPLPKRRPLVVSDAVRRERQALYMEDIDIDPVSLEMDEPARSIEAYSTSEYAEDLSTKEVVSVTKVAIEMMDTSETELTSESSSNSADESLELLFQIENTQNM